LDRRLILISEEFNSVYTRYADDMTFSTNEDRVYGGKFFRKLEGALRDDGFYLNVMKSRLLRDGMRKEVTGVTVNQFPNVSRKLLREVRAMQYNLKNKGLTACQDKYEQMGGSGSFENVLGGKLEFIRMVKTNKSHDQTSQL
jgi:hypothetical protein